MIFRAKFRDGLKTLGLYDLAPASVWKKGWVIHSEAAGRGPEVIRYLARYVYRVALTNSCIVSLKNDRVTFRYQPSDTKIWKSMTLPALVFMARFLQHVLPRRFPKVRYYGFLHPRCRHKLKAVRKQLNLLPALPVADEPHSPMLCPHCQAPLMLIGRLPRVRAPP